LSAEVAAGVEALLPDELVHRLELALPVGCASRVRRDGGYLRVNQEVLVDDLDVTLILLEQLVQGRTDPVAERSSKLEGLDDGDFGILGPAERRAVDVDGVDVVR